MREVQIPKKADVRSESSENWWIYEGQGQKSCTERNWEEVVCFWSDWFCCRGGGRKIMGQVPGNNILSSLSLVEFESHNDAVILGV